MKLGRRGREAGEGGGGEVPEHLSLYPKRGGGEARLMRQKEQQRGPYHSISSPKRPLSNLWRRCTVAFRARHRQHRTTSGSNSPSERDRSYGSGERRRALPWDSFRGKALSPLWGKRRKRGGGERRSRDAIFSPYFYDPPFISYNNTWKAEVGRKKPRGKRGGNKGRRRKSQGGRGATVPNKILTSPKGEKGAERKEERCEEDPASR